ncbi:hypothetical protein ACFL5Z_01130 [Planctomycetota bacterium]
MKDEDSNLIDSHFGSFFHFRLVVVARAGGTGTGIGRTFTGRSINAGAVAARTDASGNFLCGAVNQRALFEGALVKWREGSEDL